MLANTNGPAKLPNSVSDGERELALSLAVVQSAAIVCIVLRFCSVGLRLMQVLHKRKGEKGVTVRNGLVSPLAQLLCMNRASPTLICYWDGAEA